MILAKSIVLDGMISGDEQLQNWVLHVERVSKRLRTQRERGA